MNSELWLKTKTKTHLLDASYSSETYLIDALYHGIQTWIFHIFICSIRKNKQTNKTPHIFYENDILHEENCSVKKQIHTEKQFWQKELISPIYPSFMLNVNCSYLEKILYWNLLSLLTILRSSESQWSLVLRPQLVSHGSKFWPPRMNIDFGL